MKSEGDEEAGKLETNEPESKRPKLDIETCVDTKGILIPTWQLLNFYDSNNSFRHFWPQEYPPWTHSVQCYDILPKTKLAIHVDCCSRKEVQHHGRDETEIIDRLLCHNYYYYCLIIYSM